MQACRVLQLTRVVEVLDVPSLVIILSRKLVKKALISLRIYAGLSAPLLFACHNIKFPLATRPFIDIK